MNRWLCATGAAIVAITATACSQPEATAPSTTAVATTPTTTVPATAPSTSSTTTIATEPPRPVVTAVPVVMPIERQVTTVAPETTVPVAPPEGADNPAQEWTGSNNSGNTAPLQVGWIQIPKIGINYTAYRAGDEQSSTAVTNALNKGPTFWGTTTKPGEVGNVVIGGHRVSHGAYFRNIDQLAPGDEIIVAGLDGVPHTYLVEKTEITGPNDTWIVNFREGATVTLFACHPPGSIRQRIVVFANLKT